MVCVGETSDVIPWNLQFIPTTFLFYYKHTEPVYKWTNRKTSYTTMNTKWIWEMKTFSHGAQKLINQAPSEN